MPAKTPMYLKTTTPKRGKKLKLRDVLSGDMISPPLGDVRHSAHVGPEGEGDMFGDVGFLQGKMDMLASLNRPQSGPGRSNSMERCLDDSFTTTSSAHDYSYNGHHYHKSPTGMLKTTISMPVFVTHEQAPPKPPRLHLQDDPTPPSLPSQSHFNHAYPHHHQQLQLMQLNDHVQNDTGNAHSYNHSNAHKQSQSNGYNHSQQQHHPLSLFENGIVGRFASDPCRDISFSPSIHRLVPTSGSLSEVSSEDSMSETCGPLDPRRGLSLDSDAGLSNEDLRSERSDSPCSPGATPLLCHSGSSSSPSSSTSGVTRSDSMAGLNLDLGPSILEDVLGIMDRYKAVDHRCEL